MRNATPVLLSISEKLGFMRNIHKRKRDYGALNSRLSKIECIASKDGNNHYFGQHNLHE